MLAAARALAELTLTRGWMMRGRQKAESAAEVQTGRKHLGSGLCRSSRTWAWPGSQNQALPPRAQRLRS